MRSITLMGTAAVVLTATTLLAVPASAERICRQVCDEGFCRSRCVESRVVTAFTCTTAIETTTTIVAQALNSMDRDLTLMSAARA
jgi:hypothetical protein